jgi:hypothetical protein
MAGIERLVPTSELKTGYLAKLAKSKSQSLFVSYDKEFDALTLQVVPPEVETVVHYVDDNVALLYRPADLEVVGLQVESFERSFLPRHESVRKVWKLSDACADLDDFGDVILIVERLKSKVAQEVAKAAEDVLGEPGAELVAALA